MTEKMFEVDEKTTIAALRQLCGEELKQGNGTLEEEIAATEKRQKADKENTLQPFTLMGHKPNFVILGAYNSKGYDASAYREQFDDQSLEFNDIETQFQVSVKVPLAVNLFDSLDIFAAYTNHSFWQVYDTKSSPFRETNHEPEGWVQINPNWELWGFKNSANMFGIVHQSNGQGGVLSRSWNRLFANFIVEKGNLVLSFKPWYRIPEEEDDDDNPDLTDYLGHFELRAAYKWHDHVFSAMSRNNLESGFDKGAAELSWSFPLWGYPYLKGYVQYFYGYGESLIDYDNKVNRIGLGLSLTDWL